LRVFPAKDVTTAGILCFFKKRTLFTWASAHIKPCQTMEVFTSEYLNRLAYTSLRNQTTQSFSSGTYSVNEPNCEFPLWSKLLRQLKMCGLYKPQNVWMLLVSSLNKLELSLIKLYNISLRKTHILARGTVHRKGTAAKKGHAKITAYPPECEVPK
jgi:hypothetical protein